MDAAKLEAQQRVSALEWIPQPMRERMDAAGVRISLADWQAMSLAHRRQLADASARPWLADRDFTCLLRIALGREPVRASRATACHPGVRGLDSQASH